MPDRPDDVPRGLVVPALTGDSRRSWILRGVLVVLAAATAGLIWPVYPAVSSIRPYVLGLPFSFAWVVGWLVVVFGALVVLYRAEPTDRDASD